MNPNCRKCSKFTNNNNNIKIKPEIDRKINSNSHCISCSFKNYKTIDKEQISDILKNLNCI